MKTKGLDSFLSKWSAELEIKLKLLTKKLLNFWGLRKDMSSLYLPLSEFSFCA